MARSVLILLALLSLTSGLAQVPTAHAQRPLSHQDFDAWRSIFASTLSRDGHWLAYAFMPLEGDGEVIVRNLVTDQEHRIPIGSLPPSPVTAASHNPERQAPRREPTIVFTRDSRFVVATLFPTYEERRHARRHRDAPATPDGLIVLDLTSSDIRRVNRVKSFQIPAQGGPWIALLQESPPGRRPGEAEGSPAPAGGNELILRRLTDPTPESTDRVFPGVTDYAFSRDGRSLVLAQTSIDREKNGVFVVTPGQNDPARPLAVGPGRFHRLSWDRRQNRLAFLRDQEAAVPVGSTASCSVYVWNRSESTAVERLPATTSALRPGYRISPDHTPVFTFTGAALQVFTAPTPKPVRAPDPHADDEDRVSADLWHWRDDFLPPMQQQRAPQDRIRAYAARLDLTTGELRQIADPTVPTVVFNHDGSRAFGHDDRAYRVRLDYEGPFHDLILFNAESPAGRRVKTGLDAAAGTQWSPDGRWLAFYSDRRWHAVEADSGRVVPLTAGLDTRFDQETADHPKAPASYGAAGWTTDSAYFLAYDRFDLWQLSPHGQPARNLTTGMGRATQTVLRVQPPAPREPDDDRQGIDSAEPLLLRGESEVTRATGFFRTRFDTSEPPARLIWRDDALTVVARAPDADRVLFTASRFDAYPDLQVTDSTFAAPRRVSDGDAQRAPFLWGKAELRTFRSHHGQTLSSALFKPAGFDPARRYPLIVYLYERLSQTVHTFVPPAPGTSINPSFYTSRGYAVLMPDIAYRVGEPGASALACVMPALEEVVREGWVDESAIGLQGHSWGGYQTAYLVTQTRRFRAAAAGAAVGNMTSAYSGISTGSGRARQYKYEWEQSRIGQPVYENPLAYLENSPVFRAHRVTTPLLLLHNEGDDTVPWEQGIELFLALRRAGKEVYLFNYHGEFHGLRRRADQRDYTRRLQQFFDHHLKGEPKPEWMERGISYLERDDEKLQAQSSP